MAKADSTQDTAHSIPAAGLSFGQSLQFKLGALFLLALLLLSASAFLVSRTLVQDKLFDESFRYEQEAGLRLTAELRTLIGDIQSLADALANLAADPGIGIEQLRSAAPALLKDRAAADLVVSLGIWPEPNRLPGIGERGSLYWLREAKGSLVARNDYNDSRSAPYHRERWYTPARYLATGKGYWSAQRKEPLASREVITYSVPIWVGSTFSGVVTLSLGTQALNERFGKLSETDSSRYALLLDANQRLIGVSPMAAGVLAEKAGLGTTLAALAQNETSYTQLSLDQFKRSEALRTAVTQSPRYDAKQVSSLKSSTRDLSRQEADDILTSLWAADTMGNSPPAITRSTIERDVVLREPAWASLFELHNPAWTLVLITPAHEGFAGASYLFRQSLVLTLGLVTLALGLAFIAVRALVIRPLQKMSAQLNGAHTPEEAMRLVIDTSARNELGLLAQGVNERIQQLRDASDHLRAIKSQLGSESSERRSAQEQLARAFERTTLTLQSISDAVITTNDQGQIEEMNAVAEILTSYALREARGKRLTELVQLHRDDTTDALDIASEAIARGTRLDYPDTLTLQLRTGAVRQITLSSMPIRVQGRLTGAILVFREQQQGNPLTAANPSASPGPHHQDALTGLPTRMLCERRLHSLIEQIKSAAKGNEPMHALILLDIDHLKRVNDTGGLAAGDDVLLRVAQTLHEVAPAARDVYRITAGQFAVVLESVDYSAAQAAAEMLREKIATAHFYWDSKLFSVTASFGVTLLDRQTPSMEEAFRRAYDACVAARRAGRNRVLFYDARADRTGRFVDDDTWARCIRRGLDENLFHLRTQWLRASTPHQAEGALYEVVLALEDEEGFWASPETFMPVAERHNLARSIDLWTIHQTLGHLEERPQLSATLAFCCIHLSAASVADAEFLDFITSRFDKAPSLAAKICFVLHEQTLSQHPRQAALCCDVLHRIGCKLAIDHRFGGHLSELTLLRRLPVDFIKLNARSFRDLGSDPVEQMLAESTLRIVRHLNLRVMVNQLDTAVSLDIWSKLGADYFQGDVVARPALVAFQAGH